MSILKAVDIHKSFYTGEDRVDVLKGINLEIDKGRQIALCGPSGAGKSTLLHILGLLDRATRGSIYFQDQNLEYLSPGKLANLRNRDIGFVFQFHHLLPEFNAIENVALPRLIAEGKMMDREVENRAAGLLSRMGLGNRGSHYPNELSAGEQQRVAISRALINEPELILADEPTGNLDRETGMMVFDLLLNIQKENGKAFILVTHNQELARLCDRVLYLEDGKIRT